MVNKVVDIISARPDLRGADILRRGAFRLPLARLRIRSQDRRMHRRPQAEAAQIRRRAARRRHLRRRSERQGEENAHGHAAKRSPPLNPDQYTETKALEHATQQARARNYQDFLIVDVDSHHYESESYKEVFTYIESPVIKLEAMDSMSRAGRSGFLNNQVGYQSLGGRMTRHTNRASYKGTRRPPSRHRHDDRLDGRHGRRLLLPVPDPDAVPRPASAGRDGGRALPRL